METNHALPMKVYPCGYAEHASQIDVLMQQDPRLLLIDIRYSPRSRIPGWSQAALRRRFGERYRSSGTTLGNVNYARGGPIQLADPEQGIAGLLRYLSEGYNLIVLCGCKEYEHCHRRVVVELLCQRVPHVQVIHPDSLYQLAKER